MATAFRNLLIADSRGVGIGDPSSYDYLAMPQGNSFGTAYTSAPTVTLSGGVGTGAAAAADVYRNADGSPNSNQAAMVGIPSRGRGFTNGSALPTITVTGGGGYAQLSGNSHVTLVRCRYQDTSGIMHAL